MRTPLLFAFASILSTGSSAQCSMLIYPSPGHIQVTTNSSINAIGTVYWICSGLTVNILSSPGSVYMCESNVTLNIIDSDGDQVFAKPGCVINNNSTQDIGVTCDPPTVTLNNNSSGTLTVDMICSPVVYDYSMVGGPGSCASTGMSEVELTNISLYPNPFTSFVMVAGAENKGEAKLFNALGDQVGLWAIEKGTNKFEMAGLRPGVYFLQVRTSDGVATKKMVKQ